MPLPGAVLFPHALLPLYIFEARYRKMLEHALRKHRMFCVTLVKPICPDWDAPEDFFHLATAGLIRACVERSDGTSNLVLQGLQRVRFTSFEREKALSDRQHRDRRIARRHYRRDRSARRKSDRALRQPKARSPSASRKTGSVSFRIARSGNAGGPNGFDVCERSIAAATTARRTLAQSAPPLSHQIFTRRDRQRRCVGTGD